MPPGTDDDGYIFYIVNFSSVDLRSTDVTFFT